jgi:hypothetical protein
MNSLYPYLWVLLAYSALYLSVKYLYHWFDKDSGTSVPSREATESSGPGN